jgi:hypothetical protein
MNNKKLGKTLRFAILGLAGVATTASAGNPQKYDAGVASVKIVAQRAIGAIKPQAQNLSVRQVAYAGKPFRIEAVVSNMTLGQEPMVCLEAGIECEDSNGKLTKSMYKSFTDATKLTAASTTLSIKDVKLSGFPGNPLPFACTVVATVKHDHSCSPNYSNTQPDTPWKDTKGSNDSAKASFTLME